MKLKINEVIEDVRDELLCYEEGEAVVDSWEMNFGNGLRKTRASIRILLLTRAAFF